MSTTFALKRYCHQLRRYFTFISIDTRTRFSGTVAKSSRAVAQTFNNFSSISRPILNQNLTFNCKSLKIKRGINPSIGAAAFIMSNPNSGGSHLSKRVQAQREKFLNLDLEKKREIYECGDNYSTMEDVLTWPEYFEARQIPPAAVDGKPFQVNQELNSKVSLWEGDITAIEISCIVNAANSTLLGGGGVDGAIHRAAGPKLLDECRELDGCDVGEAKISGGYRLPAQYIIHTVGPQGEKPDLLRKTYLSTLKLMVQNKLRTIAIPCISTGIYGYPQLPAAHVAIPTVREFLEENSDKVDRVVFTVFLPSDMLIYQELMQKYFPLQ